MKRKIIIAAVLLGVALLSSTATFAATYQLPWTKNIYNVSDPDERRNPGVSVFDDAGNKCYVAHSDAGTGYASDAVAISCIRGGDR